MLRTAVKAIASITAATAIIGASAPLGVRITDTTAAAKKKTVATKYFCSTLPPGAVVSAVNSGSQSVIA